MNWYFTLDDIDIEEPTGFADIELSITRDEKYHGMSYEASTSVISFYGAAADYLRAKHQEEGVKARVIFSAFVSCGTYDLEQVLTGRLNFGRYKETRGNLCQVTIPWEQESCALTLNARFDQKVDIDRAVGVDNMSGLPDYAGLAVDTELPAHKLFASVNGQVAEEGDEVSSDIFIPKTKVFEVRPTFSRVIYESINESELVPSVFAASNNGANDPIISPVLLLDDDIRCFDGVFNYETRIKGSYGYDYRKGGITDFDMDSVQLVVAIGEFPGSLTVLHVENLPFEDESAYGTFDFTYSGPITIPQGSGFYIYFESVGHNSGGSDWSLKAGGFVRWDAESYINISGVKACPSTQAELYLIHETLSRTAEAITNGCVRVKSAYYGRTDSQPFAFPSDGCGGLRSLTSGLKIRRAIEDKFFGSLQDFIDGLNAIDNIGFDIMPDDTIPAGQVMRVEDVGFFYQNKEVLRHDFIPNADSEVEETKHYSKINVGYKKWEVEEVNGLGEFNSNRVYNTSIDTINSTLEIQSGLVAGSFPIEITRQQSFADSGGADNSYDNEIFIICLRRDGLYTGLKVEQGNVTAPANIFSPETVYNYRISPVRNLMRWYKSIAAGYAALYDTANQLFFSAGTGNLIAEGLMTDTTCRNEGAVIRENQNIFVTIYPDVSSAAPIWKNELIEYEYPMSISDYQAIKTDPYGYISYQCGNGEWLKGFIKEIKYRPAKGDATIILRKKYGV